MEEPKTDSGPRLLRGLALAEEVERRVRARGEAFQQASGRPATAVVVGWAADPTTGSAVAAKRRAFERAGLTIEAVVLDSAGGTEAILQRIDALNEDPGVDGILVQFPFPPGINGRAVMDRVVGSKDIDGGSAWSRQQLIDSGPSGSGFFIPATAAAVPRLLRAHEIPLEGRPVAVVGGQPAIAGPLPPLLEAVGARVVEVEPGTTADEAARRISEVDLVVAAVGKANALPSDWLPQECVLVDTGYYHGGGRGDVAPGSGMTRVAAWVPPMGGVGPVTVALLMENTIAAAEADP